jgi:hypothetical protein
MTDSTLPAWQTFLRKFVTRRPIAILRLEDHQYGALLRSSKGMREFTLHIPHDYLREVVAPCLCLITGTRLQGLQDHDEGEEMLYVGVIKSKQVTATLDTRIKVERTARVTPSASQLAGLIQEARAAERFSTRLADPSPLTKLSPKLSETVVDTIANSQGNHGALRMVSAGLEAPPVDPSTRLQGDAIDMALKVFGLSGDAPAAHLELVKGKESRLVGARIMEDSVIEHDARRVPEFQLVGSDATGRAMFRKGQQTLEVITANRKKLEEVFGVDLIYINHFHDNLVMVQYKMLEYGGASGHDDWTYTQDRHLSKQLGAMQRFSRSAVSSEETYRLSDDFFYLKFVRRYGDSESSFLLPLEHFKSLASGSARAPRSKKVRLSYADLEGCYMRQTAFYSLLQSGYIGADSSTTAALQTLIEDLIAGGDALVVAIQRETTSAEDDADQARRMQDWDDTEAGYH